MKKQRKKDRRRQKKGPSHAGTRIDAPSGRRRTTDLVLVCLFVSRESRERKDEIDCLYMIPEFMLIMYTFD